MSDALDPTRSTTFAFPVTSNRLESGSLGGVVQEEYLYNAMGQQVVRRMTQAGKTIHVVHDLDGNRLAEYEIDNLTGASTLLQEYIWFDGVPVAVVDGQTDAVFFVRTDHIGRPVFATDDTGAKVWEASYLPFGGVHVSTGDVIDLRFPGQWFHAENGLHQNWMRDYDPTTGRYIQADPLGLVDGASIYGYVRQNPSVFADVTGECPWCVAAAVGGAAAAAISLFEQLAQNGWQLECVNPWKIVGAAAFGAAFSAGGFAATGVKRAGKEFSHFVPSRVLKKTRFGRSFDKKSNKYRALNGNYVKPSTHARTDTNRHLPGGTPTLPLPVRAPIRTPLWAYGGPSAGIGLAPFDFSACGCE